ncbi:DUF4293 family protein [Elizabethkingia argenteiflava]
MFLAVLTAIIGLWMNTTSWIPSNFPIMETAAGSSVLLGLISIFSYKNRKRQILLNSISIFINALLIGLLVYWLLTLPGGVFFPEKGIELISPLISIVMLSIANTYIRKDEKLVKSVDRFR